MSDVNVEFLMHFVNLQTISFSSNRFVDLGNHNKSFQPEATKPLSLSSFDAIRALENVLHLHLGLTTETTFTECHT